MVDESARPQQPGDGPGAPFQRDPIVTAFLGLLAEKRFEDIGYGEIARRAGVSLAELRIKHASKIELLAAHMREVDRIVLDGIDPALEDEPPRERLFDVLMRRLDVLAPSKAAIRSLRQSMIFNPGLTLAVNGLAVRSMQWMLVGANISASGPKGALRAQGLALLYSSVMRTWLDDEDPGQARTLAALDRALSSGARWAGLLDDLFRIPEAACSATRALRRRRREDRDRGRESAAA